MLAVELIRKKRDGMILNEEEIRHFFGTVTSGETKDYQASAMLMAIFLRGMNRQEAACLTKVMRDSGRVLKWDVPAHKVVDKHSTGGIGDKTSLVILPLATLHGLTVPMMSGRGLGHTGGTLDKLESIPGMNVFQTPEQARAIVREFGGVFIGQTADLAPLDKKLYSLRDVTGTVESIPLITASILSKKLAENVGALVMDVKFGSGAFMQEKSAATELARSLQAVGNECGLKITCLLTNMNSPLGRTAGNSLEVVECLDVMRGEGPDDTINLTLELTLEMLKLANPKLDSEETMQQFRNDLSSGRALEKFARIVAKQGGDTKVLENPKLFAKAKLTKEVVADRDGFVGKIDVRELGMAVVVLGGGRRCAEDKVDPAVGLSELLRVGEKVTKGQPMALIHANEESRLAEACAMVKKSYQLTDRQIHEPLIEERFH